MATRQAKLPRGIIKRTNPSGATTYSYQIYRGSERLRKSGYRTLKAALEARDKHLALLNGESEIKLGDTNMTVTELYEQWMDKYVRVALATSTIAGYEMLWRNQLGPLLSSMPVRNVDSQVVREVVSRLKKAGTGGRTINKAITAASSMFSYSIETHHFPAANPWHADRRGNSRSKHKLRVAEVKERPVRPQPIANIYELARAMKHPRDRAMLLVDLYTGLRAGELAALRWSDVFTDCVLVTGTIVAMTRERVDFTKTGTGGRTIELFDLGRDVLGEWRKHADPQHELVFCMADGSPIHMSTWYRDAFNPAVKRTNVPRFTLQNVRQTFVSNMLMAGKNPLWVAGQAGHSVDVMYKHYARFVPSLQDDVQLTRYFGPAA